MNKFIILVLALTATQVLGQSFYDPNTYSNFQYVYTNRWHLNIDLDFDQEKIRGNMNINMTSRQDNLTHINLDVWKLSVQGVFDSNFNSLIYDIIQPTVDVEGEQLQIQLNEQLQEGESIELIINYQTTGESTSLSWVDKYKTPGKVLPFLYSVNEPIGARSVFPCQDTPSIRSPWTANITYTLGDSQINSDGEMNIFMSANATETVTTAANNKKVFMFEAVVPVPTYQVAIVAGNLVEVPIGDSGNNQLISFPSEVQAFTDLFTGIDDLVKTVEDFVELQYLFGRVRLCILPTNYPFGGQGHPHLTYLSRAAVVGTGYSEIELMRAIAYSYTGLIVTAQNWRNRWLNEGFATYISRKAILDQEGEEHFQVILANGDQLLQEDILKYPESDLTSLYPSTEFKNPFDTYNNVAAEKGSQLLETLESWVGRTNMTSIIRGWVSQHLLSSVNWWDFKNYLHDQLKTFITDPVEGEIIFWQLDLDRWVMAPGYPPSRANNSCTSCRAARILAQNFTYLNGTDHPDNYKDYIDFTDSLKILFYDYLYDQRSELNTEIFRKLIDAYDPNREVNPEVIMRILRLAIFTRSDEFGTIKGQIDKLLSEQGRERIVRPLYQAWKAMGRIDWAVSIYETNKDFYHPWVRDLIEKDLDIESYRQQQNQKLEEKLEEKFLSI